MPLSSAKSVWIPPTAPSSLSKRSSARVVGVGATGGVVGAIRATRKCTGRQVIPLARARGGR
ncbi:hypothetical protein, partial [Bartonella sp. TT29SHDZB]|uniref:hypothetical protein n=1 Tax=Bartonella sp. TT29SHDZB TaxID=3243581 RepID=UPI0035D0DDC2